MGMNNIIMELTLPIPSVHATVVKRPARLMLAVIPAGDWSADSLPDNTEGYLLHHGEPHELLAAIHALTEGIALRPERIDRRLTVRMVPESGPVVDLIGLSPRETEVLRAMVDGLSYKMVAEKLGISFETVRTHVKKVYEKMGVHNCTEAVAKALKSGLLH